MFDLGFDVFVILSGSAHYADVTDVHVTCTQFCPIATRIVFPGLSVLFFQLAFSCVSAPHTRSTLLGQAWP